MEITTQKSPRIELVDALRGFAIMIIFIIHTQEHFNIMNFPDPTSQPEWLNFLDGTILQLAFSMFAGKSYSIFALLFGFTFYIQFHNQAVKGKDFGYRFLWRMAILFVFGMFNSLFYPGGDILFIYAIVGISLFIVRRWSNKAIFITAIVLLAQPIEWIHYFISLFDSQYTLPNYNTEALYAEVKEVAMRGNWLEFFKTNITTGVKANISWTISVGRLLQTAGLFMIGYLIGRKQLFVATKENIRFWVYTLVAAAFLFNPLLELRNIMNERAIEKPIIGGTLSVVFDMWQKFAFTFVILSSFILLYQKQKFVRLTNKIVPFGRMTMTNYITQSIVGIILFLPVGFNLGKYCGGTASLLISLVLLYLQISACKWWMATHKHGPLEGIWHRLTWINSDKK